jgi:hypothetical protein
MKTRWPERDENGDVYEDYAYNLSKSYNWWKGLRYGVRINSIYIAPGMTDEDVWLDYRVYFSGKRPGIKNQQMAVAIMRKFVDGKPGRVRNLYRKWLRRAVRQRKNCFFRG